MRDSQTFSLKTWAIQRKHSIAFLVVCLCSFTLLFSTYNILSYVFETKSNQKVHQQLQQSFHQAREDLPKNIEYQDSSEAIAAIFLDESEEVAKPKKVSDHFKGLLEKNEDTKGWLHIAGTVIDYPVVQAEDNAFYLDRNFEKEKNVAGSIFLDFRNSIDELDQNTVIYGHHMKDGSMFKDLIKFKNEDFVKENPIITFETLYEVTEWEVFAVYNSDIDFNYIAPNFKTEEAFREFFEIVNEKSIYPIQESLTMNDHILTLSTCDYVFDNARWVVQARLVNSYTADQ